MCLHLSSVIIVSWDINVCYSVVPKPVWELPRTMYCTCMVYNCVFLKYSHVIYINSIWECTSCKLGVTFTFPFRTLKNTKCGLWADVVLTLLLIKLLAMSKWSWNTCIRSIRIAHQLRQFRHLVFLCISSCHTCLYL